MKLCFITCHYPPLSRTLRRYQFARYMADAGCDVEVVTHGNVSRALGAFVEDGDITAEDPQIEVHRASAPPWYLTGEVLYRLGLVSCPHVNWLKAAARTAAGIARSAADVVLSVYPPFTDHLAAQQVARDTGARFVLDYRDEFLELSPQRGRAKAAKLEKELVRQAALISVATPRIGENLIARYGLDPQKIHVTQNGYWQEVKGDLEWPETKWLEAAPIRIVYAGAISAAQGLEVLPRALAILKRNNPEIAARFEGLIYGPDNFYLRKKLNPELGDQVRYGGFLGASQVSAALLRADICFLSLASAAYAYAIPGKLYEYIAHARPLLAALPQGSAQRLIEQEGFGLVAPCADPHQLAAHLEQVASATWRRRLHQRLLKERRRFAAAPNFLSLAAKILELP